MNNVIKEFDVLMKKMRNLGFGLAANDLELAHKNNNQSNLITLCLKCHLKRHNQ